VKEFVYISISEIFPVRKLNIFRAYINSISSIKSHKLKQTFIYMEEFRCNALQSDDLSSILDELLHTNVLGYKIHDHASELGLYSFKIQYKNDNDPGRS